MDDKGTIRHPTFRPMRQEIHAIYSLLLISLTACVSEPSADTLLINGQFAQVNDSNITYQHGSVAIVEGKISAFYPQFSDLPVAKERHDLDGSIVYPGFVDAHAHYLGFGMALTSIDLLGTTSWESCLQRVADYIKAHPDQDIYRGRGWDQNDWANTTYPDNEALNALSDKAIVLNRIDGHALIANQAALTHLKLTDGELTIEGGEIHHHNGQLTGVLIDNAMDLLQLPAMSRSDKIEALLAADKACIASGLTGLHDAGLPTQDILLIDSLQREGLLHLPLQCMVSESPAAMDYWLERGKLFTERMTVRNFKFYSDGALGSRGALLREPYTDRHDHHGSQIRSVSYLQQAANRLASNGWQMSTHAIGDSANHMMLNIYEQALTGVDSNLRWRIEHAQVVSPADRHRFGGKLGIIPSIQPTHATSDMAWAGERLGKHRIHHAYAYKQLKDAAGGHLPIGTDCPVERINPLHSLYAAIHRRAIDSSDSKGFQMDNALTLPQALNGMTHEAAYAGFDEETVGQIAVGHWANFTIFEAKLHTYEPAELPHVSPIATWIHGRMYKNTHHDTTQETL